MLKRIVFVTLFVLSACSSPQVNDPCEPENSLVCDSSTVALFCEGGRLRAVECRGPGGCLEGSDRVSCDLTRARAGDACPKGAENTAQCDVGDANRALKCVAGTWTAQACTACAVQGGNVVCQP